MDINTVLPAKAGIELLEGFFTRPSSRLPSHWKWKDDQLKVKRRRIES